MNTPTNTPRNTPSDAPGDTIPGGIAAPCDLDPLEALQDQLAQLLQAGEHVVEAILAQQAPAGGWAVLRTMPGNEFDPENLAPGRYRVRLRVAGRLGPQATFSRLADPQAAQAAPNTPPPAPVPSMQGASPRLHPGGGPGGLSFDSLRNADPLVLFASMQAEMASASRAEAAELRKLVFETMGQRAAAGGAAGASVAETIQLISALQANKGRDPADPIGVLEVAERMAERFAGVDAPAAPTPRPRERTAWDALADALRPALVEVAKTWAANPANAAAQAQRPADPNAPAQAARRVPNEAAPAPTTPGVAPVASSGTTPPNPAANISVAGAAGVVALWLDILDRKRNRPDAMQVSALVAAFDDIIDPPALDAIKAHIENNVGELSGACSARGLDPMRALQLVSSAGDLLANPEPDDVSDDDDDDAQAGEGGAA
jgi:hypothetical protein